MLAELLADHEAMIRTLREDLDKADKRGDVGTNDFLTGLLEKHEKASLDAEVVPGLIPAGAGRRDAPPGTQ